jgi:hypothetical protein
VVPGGGADFPFFWTHNDSGWGEELFAVGEEGELLGTVRVAGSRNRDWEELAAGRCASGRCLYIADTGDNRRVRTDPAIYRIPEPTPGDTVSDRASRFPLSFPDGPRDVEAVILLPGERMLLVSKGWSDPIEVYRVPGSLESALTAARGDPIPLEPVQRLSPGPVGLPRMVTGAAATPDGSLVAIRTYETLQFYRVGTDGRLKEVVGGLVNLRPVGEAQGEAVAFLPGNRLVLTSEAGPMGRMGQLSILSCRLQEFDW